MLKTFFCLTRYLDKKGKKSLYPLVLLNISYPFIDIFIISIIIPIINNTVQQSDPTALSLPVILLGIAFLIKGVYSLLIHKISCNFLRNTTHVWSVKIYELYTKENLLDHNQKSAIQAMTGIMGDTEISAAFIITTIGLFTHSLTSIGYFFVIAYISKWSGMAGCVLIVVLTTLLILHNRKRIEEYGRKKRESGIKINSQISTAYGSYKEMRIDYRMKNLLTKFQHASKIHAQIQKDYDFTNSFISIILQSVILSALCFLLAAMLATGIIHQDFLSKFVAYVLFLMRMLAEANTVITSLNDLYFRKKYCKMFQSNMSRYLIMKKEEQKTIGLREKNITLNKSLRVNNLTFSYPGGENILEDASIEILPGGSTAIVGLSGAGKTTFLDLLLGLLKPQSGHIWYDDYDIVEGKDTSGKCQADLGRIVSYIPQTIYLNGETIRNNVVFMADQEEGDESRIIECLKYCQIWNDIQKMPNGIDTLIGENGISISGGQRQRIALARALYKNYEILVMDEATAALDFETESAVMDSIRQNGQNKTLLLVTHHMSLANECEFIYKIENKKFVRIK